MASAAEAVGERLAARNLFGRRLNLEVGNRGTTATLFDHSRDGERVDRRNYDGQHGREPYAGPFQISILDAIGPDARPDQRSSNDDQNCQDDDILHVALS